MNFMERDMIEQIRVDHIIDTAKREHAQAMRNALLRARLKIMHDDIFPAHIPQLVAA